MISLSETLLGISIVLSSAFFIYGFNAIHLTLRSRKYVEPEAKAGERPRVAIHLPVFNELYVIARLVGSCIGVAESYGKDLVRIVVIDDSTDETKTEVDRLVDEYSSKGYRIEVLRRGSRTGFKAGALQAALDATTEDYLAVFDADFVPSPGFLERTIPYLVSDEKIGFVQARWEHLNRGYNAVTKALAVGTDAHFFVEQAGRWDSGYFMNFNGSAGVLRRKAIVDAGGWQADTLAEDLDVSYRMQLAGYGALFLKKLTVPGELPPTITALKRQQGRWARGSIQTLKKLGPRIVHSRDLSRSQKFEAGIHLSYYAVHPLMFASFVIALVAAFLNLDVIKVGTGITTGGLPGTGPASIWSVLEGLLATAPWVTFVVLIIACTIAVLFYGIEALKAQGMSSSRNIPTLILLVMIGYGISISNSVGVFSGLLLSDSGRFARTPKYAIKTSEDKWRGKKYQVHFEKTTVLEGIAVFLALASIGWAASKGNLGIIPILTVYLVSYSFIFLLSLRQSWYSGATS